MEEIWKDIRGYEGYYQVSNLGNVRSLDRKILNGSRYIIRKGRVCTQFKRNNYYFVILHKNGKSKQINVHRLVAKAFIPNLENKPCINHKIPVTELQCINTVNNLEWVTYSENNKYAYKLGRNTINSTNKGKFGGSSHHHKKVAQINSATNEIIKIFSSLIDASNELGICKSTICQVCKKKPHKLTAGGFKWEYVDE